MKALLALATAALGLAAAAQAQTPSEPEWRGTARCLAYMERMPEIMNLGADTLSKLEAEDASGMTPEMRTATRSMAQAMRDMRPMMIQAVKEIRGFALDEARKTEGAGAEAAVERELASARVDARRFRFDAVEAKAQNGQMEAYKAAMEKACPKRPPSSP